MSALPHTKHWSNKNPDQKEMVLIHTNMTEDDAMVAFCQRGCVIKDTAGYYSIHDMKYGPFEKSFTFRCAREEETCCPPICSKEYASFQANSPEFKVSFNGKNIIIPNALFGNMRHAALARGVPVNIEEEVLWWLHNHWHHPEAIVVCRRLIVDISDITRMYRADRAVRHFTNKSLGIVEDTEEGCTRVSMAMKEVRVRSIDENPKPII